MGILDPFAAFLPANWPLLALVMARVGGVMMTAPGLAMVLASMQVRVAVVALISIILVPLVPENPFPVEDFIQLPLLVASELIVGIGMGLLVELFIAGVALAGDVVGMQMGLSAAALMDPASNVQLPVVAQFLRLFAMAVFFAVGGHILVFSALTDSFSLLPPGGTIYLSEGARTLVLLGGTMFVAAVQVAAPAIISLLLVNAAMAVLSRAAPQINVFAVSFQITIMVGILVVALVLSLIGGFVGDWMEGLVEYLLTWLATLANEPV